MVIGGKDKYTAPSPMEPVNNVKTLWGYIGQQLGKYSIIERYDDELMSPEKSTLEELFRGEKVLLLIDEIAYYLQRMKNSVFGHYYYQCLLFFENLASVINSTQSVLIVTIPARTTKDYMGIERETGYGEEVLELWKRIEKSGTILQSPISSTIDLAKVLKKRLFEDNLDTAPTQLISEYSNLVNHNRDHIDASFINDLINSYPFHPFYIKTLQRIVEVHPALQKSRDAIRISRIVVRKLFNERPSRDLVLASDIDIKRSDIQNLLLHDYDEFKNVVTEIQNKTKGLEIYFVLANYIFLNTFIYKLGMEPGNFINLLPDTKEIVTSIIDLEMLRAGNLTIADVENKIQNLNSIPYLIPYNDKYWFTAYKDPKTLCISEGQRVTDAEVINKMEQYLEGKSIIYNKKGSYNIFVNSDPYKIVSDLDELIDDDEPKYKAILVREPKTNPDESQLKYQLKRFIYNTSKGQRKNQNSIAVIFSTDQFRYNNIKENLKVTIGCEKVDENLDSYYADQITKKVAKEVLKKYMDDLENAMMTNLLNYYNKIAYPINNDVEVKNLGVEGKTVLERAEDALKSEGKLLDSFNYDLLKYHLELISVNLSNQKWNYSDILSMFYTNSSLPWVREDDIKRAILDGVERMEIGVLTNGVLYFKRKENEDYSNNIITDSSIILPAEEAAKLQIEQLQKEESKEYEQGDVVYREYYVIEYDGKTYRLESLLNEPTWLDMFRNGNLRKVSETLERGVELEVEPVEVSKPSGENENIIVKLRKVGTYQGTVNLEVLDGDTKIFEKNGIDVINQDEVISVPITVTHNTTLKVIVRYDSKEKMKDVKVSVKTLPDFITVPPEQIPENGVLTRLDLMLKSRDEITSVMSKLPQINGEKVLSGELKIEYDNGNELMTLEFSFQRIRDINTMNRRVSSAITLVGIQGTKISLDLRISINSNKPLNDREKEILKELVKYGQAEIKVRQNGEVLR
ncbi:DUF499 domain-containing protein [Acidianus sulfidivorans]|uniref:DUF499 domain-containing protein n=1 Tax=Acidianus sulfidivorans TaxID=312539 RepID=UPI0023F83622|nr:DUF499 domain-containing protein [Acidianus sulfidivorans]